MYSEFDAILANYLASNISLPDQWWDSKKVEFIYNSNKLEGNRLKLADTYSIINDKMNFSSDARFKDILEVKGHIKALDTCIFMAKSKYPLTEKSLQNIHANLLSALWKFEEYYGNWKTNGQELGEYKKINNSIKFLLDDKEGIIEPSSNAETVYANMQTVFETTNVIPHILERAAHLAFQLWYNQPFPDGNKRLARLSVAYFFMLEGLPLISFKAEGYHFNEGLLRAHSEKSLTPLMKVIETEVKQQLREIMEMDRKLKINKTPPNLGFGSALIF